MATSEQLATPQVSLTHDMNCVRREGTIALNAARHASIVKLLSFG